MQVTCQSLDNFGTAPDDPSEIVFGVKKVEWTEQMVSFLVSTTYACKNSLVKGLAQKQKLTGQLQDAISVGAERIIKKVRAINKQNGLLAADRAHAATEQARLVRDQAQKDNEASEQAKAVIRQRAAECEQTSTYSAYQAQENIISDLAQKTELISDITRNQKISRVSGVRDLAIERNNGELLVGIDENLQEHWAEYKKFGGKAISPRQVKHQLHDPCSQFKDNDENQTTAQ